eukprot:13016888-Alexandrium_andersonii.AAC.1
MSASLVGSEMCIRDSAHGGSIGIFGLRASRTGSASVRVPPSQAGVHFGRAAISGFASACGWASNLGWA